MTPREPFAELQTALSLTPSPEFATRVRARVAASPPERRLGPPLSSGSLVPHWTVGAILATAAAMLVVVNVSERREGHAVAPIASATAPVVARPKLAPPAAVIASSPATPRTTPVSAKTVTASVDPFYEVLVPDDQRIALERLLVAMKAGRASVPSSVVSAAVDADGRLDIPLLPDIVPMKIELLAEIKKEQ